MNKPEPRTVARSKAKPWVTPMLIRKLHVYSGALFAPAFLFFAVTGFIQVYNWHKPQAATGYKPSPLILAVSELHKDQVLRKPKDDPPAVKPGTSPAAAPDAKPHHGHHKGGEASAPSAAAAPEPPPAPRAPRPQPLSQVLLKLFSACASAALSAVTLLGLYMTLRNPRERWLAACLFLAGLIIPVLLLLV